MPDLIPTFSKLINDFKYVGLGSFIDNYYIFFVFAMFIFITVLAVKELVLTIRDSNPERLKNRVLTVRHLNLHTNAIFLGIMAFLMFLVVITPISLTPISYYIDDNITSLDQIIITFDGVRHIDWHKVHTNHGETFLRAFGSGYMFLLALSLTTLFYSLLHHLQQERTDTIKDDFKLIQEDKMKDKEDVNGLYSCKHKPKENKKD